MADRGLPIFPLNVVLFPGGLLPLRVFEARYMDMTRECLKTGSPFGVCLIREGREVGAPALPEAIGCTARIVDWDMQQLGVLNLVTRGEQRFRILSSEATQQGLVVAEVEDIEPDADESVPAEFADCAALIRRLIGEHGANIFTEPHRLDDAAWIGYRLSEVLPLPLPAKQKLLEMQGGRERLRILQKILDEAGAGAKSGGA